MRSPVWDASFTSDGRVMYLGEVAGRFQVFVDGVAVTDAPYAALAAREAQGTIRFMDREGWYWELAEVALPALGTTGEAVTPQVATVDASQPVTPTPVISDRPFSLFDHFLFPQERAPTFVIDSYQTAPQLGVVLGGGDRLGIQRWSLTGYVQPPLGSVTTPHYGGDVAYLGNLFAPVQIYADANFYDWGDLTSETNASGQTLNVAEERRTRDAVLAVINTYRDTLTTSLGALYTYNYSQTSLGAFGARAAGPQVTLQWESAETTRYTAERRALIFNAAAAYYPQAWSTLPANITDLGGTLGAFLPLPFGRRHTLYVDVQGRALLGAPSTPGLLQLGGAPNPLLYGAYTTGPQSLISPLPNLNFFEVLRGYEDYAIQTDRVAIADVDWKYPWIIDRGLAATARVLPASFVREVDFELFGAGAVDNAGATHAAAGLAATLRIEALRIPLIFTYQIARRLADDHAFTQLFGIGPDM